MSQHGRTSQAHTDLTAESVAGAIQGAIKGADAGPAAAMDDYDKSSAVAADNVNTTPTGAIGGIDEEVEKLQNAELEAKRTRFLQTAAEVSSVLREAVAGFSRTEQESEAEYWSAVHYAATKLSSVVREVAAKLSSPIQESRAECSNAFKGVAHLRIASKPLRIVSKPFNDLSEESVTGTIQCDLGGAEAGVIDDYVKWRIGGVDNAKTTSTGAVSGFDEEAEKVQNAELEAKGSRVVQEAAEISSIGQEAVAGFSRAQQESEAEYWSAVHDAATKLSCAVRQVAAKLSSAIQESTAEYSTTFKRIIRHFLIASHHFTDLREESIRGTVQCDLGGVEAGAIDDYDKSRASAMDNANTTTTCAAGSFDKETESVQNAGEAAEVLSFVKQDVSNAVQRAKVLLRIVKEATEVSSIYIRESRVEFSRAIQESRANYASAYGERAAELAISFQQIISLLLFSILQAGVEKGSNSVLDTAKASSFVQQATEVWRIVNEATVYLSIYIAISKTEFSRAIEKSRAKYPSVYEQRAAERTIAFQDTVDLLLFTILEGAVEKVSNSVLDIAEVSSAVHAAVAEASRNLQEVRREWLRSAEEEAETWYTIQITEARHASQKAAAEASHADQEAVEARHASQKAAVEASHAAQEFAVEISHAAREAAETSHTAQEAAAETFPSR